MKTQQYKRLNNECTVDDPTINSIRLYTPVSQQNRQDIVPFCIVYLVQYVLSYKQMNDLQWYGLMIAVGQVIFGHILQLLTCYWSIEIRMKLLYNPLSKNELNKQLKLEYNTSKELYYKGCAIARLKYQSMMNMYQLSYQWYQMRVKTIEAAYKKRLNKAANQSLVPKPQLPLPPIPPEVPLSYVSYNNNSIYVHVIPSEHCGNQAVHEQQYNDGYKDCLDVIRNDSRVNRGENILPPPPPPPFVFIYKNIKYMFISSLPNTQDHQYLTLSKNNDTVEDNIEYDFCRVQYPENYPQSTYIKCKGQNTNMLREKQSVYGKNVFFIDIPSFFMLQIQHMMAPFFVFQLQCICLWMMDEYWYYSLFTLSMLILFEVVVVVRRLFHLKEVLNMRPPATDIYVYRDGTWVEISSEDIYPGDIISLSHKVHRIARRDIKSTVQNESNNNSDNSSIDNYEKGLVPCDCVLQNGTCVVNEAMLTGESIPQVKENLCHILNENTVDIDENILKKQNTNDKDIVLPKVQQTLQQPNRQHKRYTVFGGTNQQITTPTKSTVDNDDIISNNSNILQCDKVLIDIPTPPDDGIIAYVLRTGFGTYQGSQIRTILFSVDSTMDINREAIYCLFVQQLFAIVSASYVLYEGLKNQDMPRSKLLLNIIIILTSVVSPEQPMEQSMAVNASQNALIKLRITCTEPFRIPFAGSINYVCFDKTGTLTSDEFTLLGIYVPNKINQITSLDDLPSIVRIILGSCHGLTYMTSNNSNNNKDEQIGDPIEKILFCSSGCKFSTPKTIITTNKDDINESLYQINILNNYPFSSEKKRMSCLIQYKQKSNNKTKIYIVSKGAPEVMEKQFKSSSINTNYTSIHKEYALRGCRILALGYKEYIQNKNDQQKSIQIQNREQIESEQIFAGFVIQQSPQKRDSYQVIQNQVNSSHKVIMITGDHLQTACHVAGELGMINKKKDLLVLCQKNINTIKLHDRIGMIIDDTMFYWDSISRYDNTITDDNISSQLSTKIQPLILDKKILKKLVNKYEQSITGDVLEIQQLQCKKITNDKKNIQEQVVQQYNYITIYARVVPDQKEHLQYWQKKLGHTTLMCGDGTNDVGALKQAHIGIALLSNDIRSQEEYEEELRRKDEEKQKEIQKNLKKQISKQKQSFDEMLKASMGDDTNLITRLGDASIAAPFTAKHASVICVTDIIRQGRCALVTTMQTYQILALNSQINAYSMSVLYMKGVKMGESQMTIQGIASTIFFLFMSKTQTLEEQTPHRPNARIFSPWMISTVLLQFIIHLTTLIFQSYISYQYTPTTKEITDIEAKFVPTVLNTTVFLVTMAQSAATILCNYRGRPFVQSIQENKTLFRAIMATLFMVVIQACELIPEINQKLELVPLPTSKFRFTVVITLFIDVVLSYIVSRYLTGYFEEIPPRLSNVPIDDTLLS